MFTFRTKVSIAKALLTKQSPFYVQFFITSRCDLRCRMCNIVDSNKDQTDVSLDKIRAIAVNLRKIGTGIVLLTGGEPFLRRDIPEIVRILKAQKLDVRLQSHGFKTDRQLLRQCLKNGASDINISLDSLSESLQDSINRVPHSWREALETISYITEIFPENDKICALACVLSGYNYKEIPGIVRFATEIGWYASLMPVHITDADIGYNFRSRSRALALPAEEYDDFDKIIDRLILMKKKGYSLFDSVAYLESCKHFVRTGKPDWRNKKTGVCDTPGLYFAIRPSGDFAVCGDHHYPDKLPVYDKDFPRIYTSRLFREKVKAIAATCSGCQFGSYPEVTLSVRNRAVFMGRLKDVFSPKSVKKRSYTCDELIAIAKKYSAANV